MTELVYLPWVDSNDPALAAIDDRMPDEIGPFCHKLMFGESAKAEFQDLDLVLDLSPDHGVKLADSLPNTLNLRVVSDRLRAVLAETRDPIEFHPVRVRDAKGRLARAVYHIMNPIGAIDCMDAGASDFDEDPMERGQVLTFRRLALDHARIPEDRRVFRLASKKSLMLVRKDLAYEIYRVHEHRGMIFQTLESFGEEFR